MTHDIHLVPIRREDVEGKLAPKGFLGVFWGRYPDLAQILHQIYDGHVQGLKVLDLACGDGCGVRYLRNEFGIDAWGIDIKLKKHLLELDFDNPGVSRDLWDLVNNGITINDSVENVDVYFGKNSFDVFSIVFFGGCGSWILSNNVRNPDRTVKEKLSSILKPDGYQIKVREEDMWHPGWHIPGKYVWILEEDMAGPFTGVKQHQK